MSDLRVRRPQKLILAAGLGSLLALLAAWFVPGAATLPRPAPPCQRSHCDPRLDSEDLPRPQAESHRTPLLQGKCPVF